jgi:2-phosphosulfolactate phosphatase
MQRRYVNVYHLPRDVEPVKLAGSVVVVIDLLRASSTICQALASGAIEVVPFLEVDETLAAAAKCDRLDVVLGGERGGQRIPGFDLGNSPSEYTAQVVGGRRVFMTTTNGTRALFHARVGRRVLVGAFVNLSAVSDAVRNEPQVDILCAGTGGDATREDIIAAGALVHSLTQLGRNSLIKNSAADEAESAWENVLALASSTGRTISEQVARELRDTAGGHNLLAIGLEQDLVQCAKVDHLDVVPELDAELWRIHLPSR